MMSFVFLVFIGIILFPFLSFGFRQTSLIPTTRYSTQLFNKIKVKLLVDVKGQGHKGEIIQVSPAMWTNVLQPKKQGEKISDEQIEKESKEKADNELKIFNYATSVSEKIQTMKNDEKLIITKKAGTTGQLFGSVTKKNILELLHKLPNNTGLDKIDDKHVHITSMKHIATASEKEKGGSDEEVDEIRKLGIYKILLQLHAKVITSFEVEVKSEK